MMTLSTSEVEQTLTLILARGGSKGLPNKNILPFAGKPLIARSIEIAKSANLSRIDVNTDSERIATVAQKHGARVLFLRTPDLAKDSSTSMAVILDHLTQLSNYNEKCSYVLLLQPTSPLRDTVDIFNAFNLLRAKKADAIVSVCCNEHHPFYSNTLPDDGSMASFIHPHIQNSNRQSLPTYYRLNGSIYLAKTSYLLKNRSFVGNKTFALIMPPERSVDIDNKLDFDFAEYLFKKNSRKSDAL